jgi:hypothetical protein
MLHAAFGERVAIRRRNSVCYDFETTQNSRYSDKATLHVPNLVCLQQFCCRCEGVADIQIDCDRCGKRKHSFWVDPVGDVLSYLCEPQPWAKKIIAVSHNAKVFDLHFILNRAILLKWQPELIMNGLKIVYENGAPRIPRLRLIYTVFPAQVVRSIWSSSHKIMVPSLFQYGRKPRLCWHYSRHRILWRQRDV